ncbi:uncharacterized protein [Henckelia pumila]|uniref:uncharacterized protein isoform X2 n=1 Tax=Henckelia pumila TaxID=405737 RepID=UPI003C6DC5F6
MEEVSLSRDTLLILAYEYYSSVAQKFFMRRDVVDGLILPRMFKWVASTWPSNCAPSNVDVSAAFGAYDINDCVGCLTPTSEDLVSSYYTTGVFVDSAPDVVTTRVLELWSQGKTVICSQRPLENDVESPIVQHTPSYHDGSSTPSSEATRSSSSTHSVDAIRSNSSTRPPIPMGPRIHFGLNPTRRTSPLEHHFRRRLSALDDTVNSLRLEMREQFIKTRACIREMKAGFDELRSCLSEQIRASLAEIRSQTAVHIQGDYNMVYNRRQKRKSYVLEADVSVDQNMVRKLFPNSSRVALPSITEESSEGAEASTSIGCDSVRPFVECVTF